ncbi:monocarboxylate transporter 10-like [Oppia nitens]|uniref:monocarboxylate transporter 10-like n=1 Tax=Oppia nitens TaxID=1686743 RepID=UPI0023DB3BC4|nr:monocarboxylate transporter 10-like [Oppia nitens]
MVNICESNGKLVSNGTNSEKQVIMKQSNGNHCTDFVAKVNKSDDVWETTNVEQNKIDSFTIHTCAIVIASATINGTIFGVVNSFGVLYVYLLEKFSAQQKVQFLEPLIAGVGSVCVGLIFFCSIFASLLTDRFGIQRICFVGGLLATVGMYSSSLSTNLTQLYITYGIILGLGASLSYAPSLVILGHYFKRRLGLVNGLVTAGSAVFTVIMPIMLKMLIESKGINGTLEYLSLLMSVLMVCALTFKENLSFNGKPKVTNEEVVKCKRKGLMKSSLYKNKLYILWAITILLSLFGYFVPFFHLVKHANDVHSEFKGEILVTCIGAFSCLGRFITGPIADISNVNRIILQQIAFCSIGLLTISITIANSFGLLLICCGLGLFDGCFISILGPIAFDLVGPENASQAIGLLLCFCSLPLTVGPPIAAYLYDVNGNYNLAFVLSGIPPLIGAFLMIFILKLQRNIRQKVKLSYEDTNAYKSVSGNGLKETNNKLCVTLVNNDV